MTTKVLYDGYCVMCRQTIRTIGLLDWTHRITPIDIQEQTLLAERYPTLDYETLMGAIHVITVDGRILVGFFAIRYLSRFLPLAWPILPMLYLPGMKWLGPKLYRWVARRRYAINRLFGRPTCENGHCKIA